MADKYADALRELDQMRAAGQIDAARYDLHRAKLLAEASRPRPTLPTRILALTAGILIFILVALGIIRAIMAATS